MPETDFIQAGFLRPIFQYLSNSGSNTQQVLRSADIPQFSLDHAENYVPTRSVYALMSLLNRKEGVVNLADEFVNLTNPLGLVSQMDLTLNTPDLLTACRFASKYDSVVVTNERIELEIKGSLTTLSSWYTDPPSEGRDEFDYFNLLFTLLCFQLAGEAWHPVEIHLQSMTAPNLDKILHWDNYKLYLGQPKTALVFPTSLLALGMPGSQKKDLDSCRIQPGLHHQIYGYLEDNAMPFVPGIDFMAEILEVSPRTLQRRLAREGTSYFDILDNWRFKKALELIKNPDIRLVEIMDRLSYANFPNFVRAFRRWTQASPERFRETVAI